jgi:hypothetical protein
MLNMYRLFTDALSGQHGQIAQGASWGFAAASFQLALELGITCRTDYEAKYPNPDGLRVGGQTPGEANRSDEREDSVKVFFKNALRYAAIGALIGGISEARTEAPATSAAPR